MPSIDRIAICGVMASVMMQIAATPAAHAQGPSQPASTAAGTESSESASLSDPRQVEARERFTRALELAEDGNNDAALEELKKAYALAPTYRLLYNIGIVYQALRDSARSLDAFERYLSEGGGGVPEDRVTEVTSRIERLKARVGYLNIEVKPAGAEISVDDFLLGQAPLPQKVRVNSGRRRVTASMPGHAPVTRAIELAGGETKTVSFDMTVAPSIAQKAAPKSVVPWISWGVTAALVGAAATTGVLALSATSKYDDLAKQPSLDPNELDRAYDKRGTFALATDILGGAAILAAGVSIYFTIKPPKVKSRDSVALYSSGRGVGLRYEF